MKTPLLRVESRLPLVLAEQWDIAVVASKYIPVGNSAYSYRVDTSDGRRYLVKLVDLTTVKGRETAQCMAYSLPLTWRLWQFGQFTTLAYALPTLTGTFSHREDEVLYAVYPFVDGESLADAYPMPDALVGEIAAQMRRLHATSIADLSVAVPHESFDTPFVSDLLATIEWIGVLPSSAPGYQRRLRNLVWPQRDRIARFVRHLAEAQARARYAAMPLVLCHGDVWGGNLIRDERGQLIFVDWESAVIAPRERDAFGYIGQFEMFAQGYGAAPSEWNGDALAFFAYRHQLRNLWHWTRNVLYEQLEAEQIENDLDMLDEHCLRRWNGIEALLEARRQEK